VDTAYDGQQALELAGAWRPHVVLLDIGMPKMNGYDACRKMRSEPWGGAMCLVALTAGARRRTGAGPRKRLRPPPHQPVDPARS
jgi:CheY-like chemotaxis protein